MKTKRGIAWILGLLMFFSLIMGTSEMQVYAAETYSVNFGYGSWTVRDATVYAYKVNEDGGSSYEQYSGSQQLDEGMTIHIELRGFDEGTMEVKLSGDDKSSITLTVENNRTTITLPTDESAGLIGNNLTFSVVAKSSDNEGNDSDDSTNDTTDNKQGTPQNNPEPEKKEEKKVETVVQKEASTKEKAPANIVQLPGGEKAVSSIGGVYNVESVEGVAVVTQKKDVYSAVGLSNEEVKAGTNVVLYMSDCLNKKTYQEVNDVAVAANKKVAANLTADMYTITKKGVINKVRETGAPVELLIGVPQSARSANRQFSVVCIDPSKNVVTYNDMDTNPDTITVRANVFGNYAVVY
ncbi:MAG: hypothetical protein ACI4ER_00875 [Suilimivivens sp.]